MTVDPSARIDASAIVEDGATVGAETKVWHHAHIRSGASIGSRCVLGKNVFVDAEASIGDRVKIQNNVSVYSGVTVGDGVFVGPGVVFTNDLYPRADSDDWAIVRTRVEEGASLGANSTIVCGITIGRFATVAAGSVVTRSIADHRLVRGNPARLAGWMCRCGRRALEPAETDDEPRCDRCLETSS